MPPRLEFEIKETAEEQALSMEFGLEVGQEQLDVKEKGIMPKKSVEEAIKEYHEKYD